MTGQWSLPGEALGSKGVRKQASPPVPEYLAGARAGRLGDDEARRGDHHGHGHLNHPSVEDAGHSRDTAAPPQNAGARRLGAAWNCLHL